MNLKDHKAIAKIINGLVSKKNLLMKGFQRITACRLADYFEKDNICPICAKQTLWSGEIYWKCSECKFESRIDSTANKWFNREQFLKDCGVEE